MDYCVVTRSLKDQRLPSSLHSCIERITSLISLNNHFGTLIHAHGCFRLDYPPYHEQSEFLLSIYVIPRFSCKGRIFTSPKRLTILLVSFMHAECCTSINLNLQADILLSPYGGFRHCRSHTNICFVENQLSRGTIGLSPLSTAHRRIMQHSPVRSIIIWPWKDHLASGIIEVT